MAVNLRFLADVVNLVKGLGTSKDAIEENTVALEDVMKQAIDLGLQMGKTSDQIAKDISEASGIPFDRMKQAVDEVADSTHDLEKAQDDAGDAAEDAARQTTDGMKDAASSTDAVKDKASDTGRGLETLGGIAKDVLRGDFGNAAESAIGALGGIAKVAEVGGPIASAVVTLGSIISETMAKTAEDSKKRTAGMFDDMVESGQRALSTTYILAEAQDLLNDDESREKAERIKNLLGVDMRDAVLALAGDTEKLAELQGILAEKMDADPAGRLGTKYVEAAKALDQVADSADSAGAKADVLSGIQEELNGRLKTQNDEVKTLWDLTKNPPKDPKIKISVDTSQAERDLISFQQRLSGRVIRIPGAIVAPDGRQLLK